MMESMIAGVQHTSGANLGVQTFNILPGVQQGTVLIKANPGPVVTVGETTLEQLG